MPIAEVIAKHPIDFFVPMAAAVIPGISGYDTGDGEVCDSDDKDPRRQCILGVIEPFPGTQ